jgi:hypothetical protein
MVGTTRYLFQPNLEITQYEQLALLVKALESEDNPTQRILNP